MPSRVTAVDTTETRKNFSAASLPRRSAYRRPTSAKAGSETVSIDTTRVMRSRDATRAIAPAADVSRRKYSSPAGRSSGPTDGCSSRAISPTLTATSTHHPIVMSSTCHEQSTTPSTVRLGTQNAARGSWSAAIRISASTAPQTLTAQGSSRLSCGSARSATSATSRRDADAERGSDCRPVDMLGHRGPAEVAVTSSSVRAEAVSGVQSMSVGTRPSATVRATRGVQAIHSSGCTPTTMSSFGSGAP